MDDDEALARQLAEEDQLGRGSADDEDSDLQRAVAASLRESQEQRRQQQPAAPLPSSSGYPVHRTDAWRAEQAGRSAALRQTLLGVDSSSSPSSSQPQPWPASASSRPGFAPAPGSVSAAPPGGGFGPRSGSTSGSRSGSVHAPASPTRSYGRTPSGRGSDPSPRLPFDDADSTLPFGGFHSPAFGSVFGGPGGPDPSLGAMFDALTRGPLGGFDSGPDAGSQNVNLRISYPADEGEPLALSLARTTSVGALKRQLQDATGIPAARQVFFGWPVEVEARDDMQLRHLIQPTVDTVSLLLQAAEGQEEDSGIGRHSGGAPAIVGTRSSRGGSSSASAVANVGAGHQAFGSRQPIVIDDADGDDSDGQEASDSALALAAAEEGGSVAQQEALLAQYRQRARQWQQPATDFEDDAPQPMEEDSDYSDWHRAAALDRSRHVAGRAGGRDGNGLTEMERLLIGYSERDDIAAGNKPPLLTAGQTGPVAFAEAFAERHPHAPMFLQGSLREAISEARKQGRPLLLYLHDDRSPRSRDFDRMMCHSAVVSILNLYFVAWGHDVTTAANRELLFKETRSDVQLADGLTGDFPCLVVLAVSGSSLQMNKIFYEVQDPAVMAEALESEGVLLLANMTLHPSSYQHSVERQSLKEEQDAAYKASLEADRRKEAQRRAEAERQAQQAEEERHRQEQEAAAAAQAAADAAAAQEQAKRQLRPEPPESDASAIRVRFQLPDGAIANRRFPSDAHVAEVLAAVASYGFPSDKFQVRVPGGVGGGGMAVDGGPQLLREAGDPRGTLLQELFPDNKRLKMVVEERG